MIRRPPGAPRVRYGLPFLKARTGTMLTSARLPGAIEFRRPGRGSNHIMPLFIKIPVPGTTTCEPNSDTAV